MAHPFPTRRSSDLVHAGDGRLITEYAIERRVFVPYSAIPRHVIEAFVAAEDQNFFHHPGVDVLAMMRAAVTNLMNLGTGRRPVGASTITQQRSEEHTSELQSLMRISYAVFCLKKKMKPPKC